jgi:myosin heavy subunit
VQLLEDASACDTKSLFHAAAVSKTRPLLTAIDVDRELTIRTEDGQMVSVPRGSDKVSQRTPQGMEAVDNLTLLPDLDEPNMLHSLCVRYLQQKIYTRTGPILVALNPWQDLNLYQQQILNSYRNKPLDDTLPHVFAISEAAFKNLQTERKDQTILVSGDSGSGKTESTKFMMQYLAAVAHHTATTDNTEQQVSPFSCSHTSCLHFPSSPPAPAFSLLSFVRE